MTYFGFLLRFLVTPILILLVLAWYDHAKGRRLPYALGSYPAWIPVIAHCVVAVVYTTPWDNYLVATRVWWYEPELVVGVTLWYVPIEEYTFFVLQPIFTGLVLLWLARYLPAADSAPLPDAGKIRRWSTAVVFVIWTASLVKLALNWGPGTYLGLLLAWSLPPVMLQTFFGGDILWKHRRMVLLTLIPATVYLSVADALAIDGGTWTINPAQSLNIYLGGILPLEEAVFFFITNLLITFGMTLVMARESPQRLPGRLKQWLNRRTTAADTT